MMKKQVAVVTGSNKGIGYAIVKGLCEKFDGDVYLTSRNQQLGLNAVKSLNDLGYRPKFFIVDITDQKTVNELKEHMKEKYGGIDILINNAAIAFKVSSDEPFSLQAKETIRVNYFGVKDVCNTLFPILKPHARVVNLSSSAGHLSKIPGKELRGKLASENLTEPELTELMNSFVEAAQTNTYTDIGWPNSAYSVSKVGVSALTFIQQRAFNKDSRPGLIVNAVHPGYVDTDMTSHKGPLTIEQGAEAPLYAALLPKDVSEPKGAFIWYTKEIVDWVNGPVPH